MEFFFPADEDRLFGLGPETYKRMGRDPKSEIIPAWFGFVFELSTLPQTAEVKISAGSQFKLFVNGQSVLFGPCRGERDVMYIDSIDLSPWLKTGENRLLLEVLSYPEAPVEREQYGPNYCYGDNSGPVVFARGSLGDKDLSEPENWFAYIDKSMSFNAENMFFVGATEVIDGGESLKNPLFAGTWDEKKLLRPELVQAYYCDPFGELAGKRLLPRPIPLLYRKAKKFPDWSEKTIPAQSEESFVIDAGELTTAYFRIGFKGGSGSRVRLTYAESYYCRRDENGMLYKAVRDDKTGFIDGVHDYYSVMGDTVYEPFRFRTFRFVEISVKTADEPLTILPQEYIETAYPLVNTKKPVFTDSKKEKLYDVAFRTLQLCAHETYEDCPYYEQLMYACDTRLEILFTYAATDDIELPRQAIRLFGSSLLPNGFTQARFPSQLPQIIPAFALYFVLILCDYAEHTGDLEFTARYIPTAERIIETFLSKRTESGMLAPQGYWDYFDWTREWSPAGAACEPTAARDGESALQNLFFVYTVKNLSKLLLKLHRADLSEYYLKECEGLLALVEERCFVPEKGLYREGAFTDEYSQHTQIYAVLSGLAKGDKAKAIMEKVLCDDSLVQCSFMQRFYLFRALEAAGMYDRTQQLWEAWQEFIDLHCTTFPETPYDPRSDCHGWSALPLYEFSKGE